MGARWSFHTRLPVPRRCAPPSLRLPPPPGALDAAQTGPASGCLGERRSGFEAAHHAGVTSRAWRVNGMFHARCGGRRRDAPRPGTTVRYGEQTDPGSTSSSPRLEEPGHGEVPGGGEFPALGVSRLGNSSSRATTPRRVLATTLRRTWRRRPWSSTVHPVVMRASHRPRSTLWTMVPSPLPLRVIPFTSCKGPFDDGPTVAAPRVSTVPMGDTRGDLRSVGTLPGHR